MREGTTLIRAQDGTLMWKCPGCGEFHGVNGPGGERWEFNGDFVKPTLKPSVLARWKRRITDERGGYVWVDEVCHFFIEDGLIKYLSDCTHSLAGQTVPIPVWQEA